MPSAPRILAFAGSLRKDSYNKKLVRIAAACARKAGGEVTTIDLRDFPMPILDEDLEKASGMPEKAGELKRLMIGHSGFLIASPEYNSSISAALKNAIDWASRPEPGDAGQLVAFQGKTAALLSASPGALGGLRGLVHLRAILGNIGVVVLPDQVAVSRAADAFTPDEQLKDPKQAAAVDALGARLVLIVKQLGG